MLNPPPCLSGEPILAPEILRLLRRMYCQKKPPATTPPPTLSFESAGALWFGGWEFVHILTRRQAVAQDALLYSTRNIHSALSPLKRRTPPNV